MTKIVFFGVGNMGQGAHLRNYVVTPDCEVVAIIEGKSELAKKVSEKYGIKNVFATLDEFKAANIEFDGFVSSQQYTNNRNVLGELFKCGKPIFSEKPISLGVETGKELVSLEKQYNAPLMMGYHKRSDPAMEFAKNLIEEWKKSGDFGRLKYIRSTMPEGDWVNNGYDGLIQTNEEYPWICEWEPPVEYYKNPENNKYYDIYVNFYVHQINALRFLLGEDYKPTYAEPTKTLFVGKSASGIPVTIEQAPFKTTIDWYESYMVCFEKGFIQIELPAPLALNRSGNVTVMEDNGAPGNPKTWSPNLLYVHAMKNQARNFVEFVKGNRPPTCTGEEAVKDLEVIRDYVKLVDEGDF